MLPDKEWSGYPPGGLLVWGRERERTVDLGKQSLFKRTFQPGLIVMSSHWIRSVAVKSYRIKIQPDFCGLDYEWDTFERYWDDQTKTSTRVIMPGKLFNMDWRISIPDGKLKGHDLCKGGIKIIDAAEGTLLAFLPVNIINSKGKQ